MAEQLVDGVWLLELGWFPPLAANAYLVDDGAVSLVDTGLRWNVPTLRSELADAGYAVRDLDRVLLTHYDLDHTGGLEHLREVDGLPVYLGEQDARLLDDEWTPPLFHHKGAFHRVVRRLFPIPREFDVRRVRDGDEIGAFTAYHTPGHNPGHVVYVHENGAAFLGDLVWEEEGRLTYPFWLDSYDMHQLRESIRRLSPRVEYDVACVGHGDPLFDGNALPALADDL